MYLTFTQKKYFLIIHKFSNLKSRIYYNSPPQGMRSRDTAPKISAQDLTKDVDCISSSIGSLNLDSYPKVIDNRNCFTKVWGDRRAPHAPFASAVDRPQLPATVEYCISLSSLPYRNVCFFSG